MKQTSNIIEFIDLSGEEFTKIPNCLLDGKYLNYNYGLNLSNNLFDKVLEYSNIDNVCYLNLSKNNIEHVILRNCKKLISLKLDDNVNLKSIILIDCPSLKVLVLKNTYPKLKKYIRCNSELKEYKCDIFNIRY